MVDMFYFIFDNSFFLAGFCTDSVCCTYAIFAFCFFCENEMISMHLHTLPCFIALILSRYLYVLVVNVQTIEYVFFCNI